MDPRAEDKTPEIPKGTLDTVSETLIMKHFYDDHERETVKTDTEEVEE